MTRDLIDRADALAAIALGDTVSQLQAKILAIPAAALPARGVGVKPWGWIGGNVACHHAHVNELAEGLQSCTSCGAVRSAALAPTDAAHVNETPKSEHDGADVLTDAAQARQDDTASRRRKLMGHMDDQKGGDAHAVRHAPHETSPGVTAGADAAQAREEALRSLASFVSGMDESTFFSFANDMDRAFETHRATEASDRILALIGEART